MSAEVASAVLDTQRLSALHDLGLLDTPAEEAFDRLANLAARILHTPVALVSLVDSDRQFFKSCLGLPEPWSRWRQTPLSHSFCQHVVATSKPLVIRDARLDPQLRDNLAIPDLRVIAYLGCPLILPGGQVIGSFCVIDSKPRDWSPEDIGIVRDLATEVMTEIELRQMRNHFETLVQTQAMTMTAALREREARYRELVQLASDGIFVSDAAGRFIEVNAAGCALVGYSPEELQKLEFADLLPPEDRERDPPRLDALLAGRTIMRERRLLRRDGTIVPVEVSVKQMPGGRIQGIVRDISARKQAEAETQRLGRLLDASANEIYLADPKTLRILYANEAAQQALGYRLDELQEMTPVDLVPGLADREIQELFAPLFEGKQTQVVLEARHRRKDGSVYPIEVRLQLVMDEGGPRIIAVINDISARKRVDELIAMLARGAADMTFGQFLTDALRVLAATYGARYAFVGRLVEPERRRVETRAVWAGDRLADNFTYDLEGTPCQDILNHQAELIDHDAWRRYPKDTMLKDMGVESYFGAPMVSSEGRMFGLVSVMDVKPMVVEPWVRPVLRVFATRLANEFERAERQAELKARNIEMENFIYTISHDLKSPLITIGGFMSLLRKDVERGDRAAIEDSIREITKGVTVMQAHIRDLLLFSRTGRVQAERTEVSLGKLVEEIVAQFGRRLEVEQAELIVAPDLPTIRVDRRGFSRVYTNLIDNAIQYRRPDVNPRIEIGWTRTGLELQLFVRDNGQGIKPAYQERIFGLFQRADSKTEGTGVGLAISKRVIEAHGGRMWVESKPGEGAAFWIALPATIVVS